MSNESNCWRDILSLCEASKGFIPNIRSLVGSGEDILFWRHNWIGGCPLNILLPNLYSQIISKDFALSMLEGLVEGRWQWQVRSGFEVLSSMVMAESNKLKELFIGVELCPQQSDRYVWPFDGSNINALLSSPVILFLLGNILVQIWW